MATMSRIPPELHIDILSRLHPKDVLRCMCVSKDWNFLIRDPRFIKAHLHASTKTNSCRALMLATYAWSHETLGLATTLLSVPFNDGSDAFVTAVPIEPLPYGHAGIVGYSGGLFCIVNKNARQVYDDDKDADFAAFWNPLIRRMKKIPSTTFDMEGPRYDRHYGFGYDSANDDYKLVAIAQCLNKYDVALSSGAKVYSMKLSSWKVIQNMPCNGSTVIEDHFVLLKGGLHWLTSNNNNNQYAILAFDLARETFKEFPVAVDNHDDDSELILELVDGCLCICISPCMTGHEIWIMKEYGVTESWTRFYSFVGPCESWMYCRKKPLVFSENGKMVIFTSRCRPWGDIGEKNCNRVKVFDLPHPFAKATVYWGSLCLLDGDPVTDGME